MQPFAAACWIISDGGRGIENQALGLAEAMARETPLTLTTFKIENGAAFRAMPPLVQFKMRRHPEDHHLPYIDTASRPEFAIGCGRQAIAPLLALKAHHPEIFTVYIQHPRIDPAKFDLVIAPEHDGLTGVNVEPMIGSPNRVTRERMITETLRFSAKLERLPMPRVAMLIGGPSKTHKMSKADHALHMQAAKSVLGAGHSLMITSSRRTPHWAVTEYKRLASRHDHIWLYDGEGENPYYALLGGAEAILITQDSTNMLTEACSTGKAVFTLPMTLPKSGTSGKFEALYRALETRCHLTPFCGELLGTDYTALNETERAAARVLAHAQARRAVFN